jgi:hypothetical protein
MSQLQHTNSNKVSVQYGDDYGHFWNSTYKEVYVGSLYKKTYQVDPSNFIT